MDFYVPNKKIACTPLGEYKNIKLTGVGFKVAAQKTGLLELTVVHGNERYAAGDRVWVRGDVMTLNWTNEVFTGPGDKPFILVPEEYIQLQDQVGERAADAAFHRWADELAAKVG